MRWTEKSSSGRYISSHHQSVSNIQCRRLKKVQGKKKRDTAAAAAAKELAGVETYEEVDEGGGGDLLSTKDEDVIF
jgi:V-type H+-transporting ATPase subunit D